MRWEELDLEKDVWTLPAKRTKARRSHAVHLTLQDTGRIGATTWAVHDPVNAAGAKDLLGDRSDRVFAPRYNLANGVEASRRMAALFGELRRKRYHAVGAHEADSTAR
jgi:hypothetical protein